MNNIDKLPIEINNKLTELIRELDKLYLDPSVSDTDMKVLAKTVISNVLAITVDNFDEAIEIISEVLVNKKLLVEAIKQVHEGHVKLLQKLKVM